MEETVTRKVQMIQLEIMREIHRIAVKNDIRYSLCAGSILGAIRHKGFIPWDDDLDIMARREEYDRLLDVLGKELPDEYWLQAYSTDEGYWQPFAKVRKRGTIYKEKGQENISDDKCGVWVDIFPIDKAQRKKSFTLKLRQYFIKMIGFSLRITELGYKCRSFSRRYIPILWLLSKLPKKFRKIVQESLMKGICTSDNYEVDVNLASTYKIEKERYPLEWMNSLHLCQFEDAEFYVTDYYHDYLSQLYGAYMKLPPEEKRTGHSISEMCKISI